MATSKAKQKDKVKAAAELGVTKAAQMGLQGFDDHAVSKTIIAAFKAADKEGAARDAKAEAAFHIVTIATTLRHSEDNRNLVDEAFQSGWRYSMKGILQRLHAAKVSWVEATERKMADGTIKQGYRLTSYGQNISSNAQTAAVLLTPEDVDKAGSLQAVRKCIKKKREVLAVEAMSDVERACKAKLEVFNDGVKVLRDLLKEAESPEAYDLAIEGIGALIEANTNPEIEVPEDTEDQAEAA